MATINVDADDKEKKQEKILKLNSETIKAIEDVEKGIGLSKGYTDLDEMWKDLEKED